MEYVNAFWVGGAICVVAQILIDKTKLTPARILTLFVVAGVVLGAFGFYDKLIDFAGAGATVPILGFGHTLAKGVEQAVAQHGFVGIFTGGMTACAGGVSASLIFGFIASTLAKSKSQS